ncbi:MAG: 30S ribosomal protein S6 [Jaaginema sp. PMC 1079.18]|nr:30S ribosomal protein S6 [Jaaginema sp. PMC 1080.18]MEC4849508.1 30S ribosomal protein S6 [Jaaginema sp. PMC 1079.18]MEC4865613.1 30S ribosomal protein S6 [Jaaginema sp. PMC 1078.18]
MVSRNYEMMYVLRPDLPEERVNAEVDRYSELLGSYGATQIDVQIKGKRRLAYEIERFQDGVYVQVNYKADGNQVAPLERAMRLSEEVIRYLTIRLKDDSAAEQPQEVAATEAEPATA